MRTRCHREVPQRRNIAEVLRICGFRGACAPRTVGPLEEIRREQHPPTAPPPEEPIMTTTPRTGDQTMTAQELARDWEIDPRWRNVRRDHTPDDVVSLAGPVRE